MNITVFGGSGFLGSHVADVLTDCGHDVLIFDRARSPYLKENQSMMVGDVLDEKAVVKAVEYADVVYNFIAVSDLEEAGEKPVETTKVNVLGNIFILEAARKKAVKRFIFSSSIYIYSDKGSFYRSSKQSCELFIEDYQRVYGLPFTILRYGSLYGPRSDEHNGIYRMLKNALMEGKIIREGDGEEIREYIHVTDAAKLSADILGEEYANRCVIISGREQIKIKDLVIMIREILKGKVDIEYVPAKNSVHYEITPYVFNPKLAMKIYNHEHVDMGQGLLNILHGIYQQYVIPAHPEISSETFYR